MLQLHLRTAVRSGLWRWFPQNRCQQRKENPSYCRRRAAQSATGFCHPLVSVCILLIMRATSCCTRRRRKPLTSWASKSCPPSRACRRNTPSCYRRKRRRMPNTGVRAMRCASCCSTSRTWIVCWAKTSAGRRRKRSMTGNNGHAPKRFAETRSRASCAFKGVLGALPLTSRGEFSRRQKFPENAKEGPLCPACHVCFQYGGSPQQQGKAPRKLSISCAI